MSDVVSHRPEMDEIINVITGLFGVTVEDLVERKPGRQQRNMPRQVAIYCCQRIGGGSQKKVAARFSLTHRGSVSSTVKFISSRLEHGDLKWVLMEIESSLNVT